jgi:putative ATPase
VTPPGFGGGVMLPRRGQVWRVLGALFNDKHADSLRPAVVVWSPEVNAPLLSRSTLFRLEPLTEDAMRALAQRALDAEGATADEAAIAHLINLVDGDGRAILTSLEVAIVLSGAGPPAGAGGTRPHVTLEHAEAARGARALRYERDDHYDVISAFIKSIRGSDPDAGLYWLARMITAGEDARFIARRLVILASEDIGMADPMALVVATSAAHAVEYVGLPEAQYNLSQAVVHLATAPKSNRTATAMWAAFADVQAQPAGPVPAHLRDASYRSATRIGHGVGYEYPHDDPRGWVEQEYRPDEVAGKKYYEPSNHGFEAEVKDQQSARRPPT